MLWAIKDRSTLEAVWAWRERYALGSRVHIYRTRLVHSPVWCVQTQDSVLAKGLLAQWSRGLDSRDLSF